MTEYRDARRAPPRNPSSERPSFPIEVTSMMNAATGPLDRILVCDDEELIRWSLSEHLRGEGFEVTTVKNGEECLAEAVAQAYAELGRRSGGAVEVAVRSSATAEDLPDASFAGQHETYLNVRGEAALLGAVKRCFASLFTDRAISYRKAKGFDHMEVALSIGVQQMVRSDLAGSGVMFSLDTESGFPRVAVINAAWGLGETVVQGAVDPDKYVVFKPLLDDTALSPIVEKTLGAKERNP